MTVDLSRFYATPADVDVFLREHLAEDTLLRYQRAIGGRAVSEAARSIRSDANLRQLEGAHHDAAEARAIADLIDPLKGGGHWPAELISFGPCVCPTCDGTGGDHQIGCQP